MMSRRLTVLIVLLSLCAFNPLAAIAQQGDVRGPKRTSVNRGNDKPTAGESSAETARARAVPGPAWTRDARWYQIEVSRFRNGDPANDPPGCLPWSAKPPPPGKTTEKVGEANAGDEVKRTRDPAPNTTQRRRPLRLIGKPRPGARGSDEDRTFAQRARAANEYGGDLQGLQSKLPYLKKLGVNTLYLTSIFPQAGDEKSAAVDMRHVDDSLGVANSLSGVSGETGDPKTWKFSPTDRIFHRFLVEAHKLGLRVVLEGMFGRVAAGAGASKDLESHVFALTTRWMDPNGDGDASDGVDGWVVRARGDFWRRTGRNWRIHARRTNPRAVVVGDLRGNPLGHAAAADFDVVIGHNLGGTISRFFSRPAGAYPVEQFINELARDRNGYGAFASAGQGAIILPQGGSRGGRRPAARSSGHATPTQAESARWRLAAVFQHFYAAAPMTYFGDEVGMRDPAGASAHAPLWWNDLSDPGTKSSDYRGDYLALVRMLNALREQYAPLRHGDFRPVLLDEGRRILAFGRSLGSDDVIVVMNYGDTNYQVKLPARRPGQLVRVINPQLEPLPSGGRGGPSDASIDYTKIPRLRVGGSRQFANNLGEMSLWVAPMSVRIAMLSDEE